MSSPSADLLHYSAAVRGAIIDVSLVNINTWRRNAGGALCRGLPKASGHVDPAYLDEQNIAVL